MVALESTRRFLVVSLACLVCILMGCDDDPARPDRTDPPDRWAEVPLGSVPTSTELVSIDCEGADCLAMGYRVLAKRAEPFPGTETALFERAPDETWSPAELVDLPPESYLDGAVGTGGDAVVVGWGFDGSSPHGVLYDARTPTPTSFAQSAVGLTTVDGSGAFLVAGGSSQGGVLLSSLSPGSWNIDTFPATRTNDGGFHDVYVRGDVAVACGYDDGADTLQVILRRTASTPWRLLNRNGLAFALTLQCVAFDDAGTIYVGGIEQAGSPGARAFVFVRDVHGGWTRLDLPDPEMLGGVQDICIASDGSLYLACGGETAETGTAHLLRVSGGVVTPELTPFDGKLSQVAEGPAGTLYAVGGRRMAGAASITGVLLERKP